MTGSSGGKPKEFEIGELVPGKGVYVGTWIPKDPKGWSLGKVFNIFAAPYDLGLDENGEGRRLVATYNDAVEAVGNMTNLMGHKGAPYRNGTDLLRALVSGAYNGEWFIPPGEIVIGTDRDGNRVQNDNLYRCRNTDKFTNTFKTAYASRSDHGHWYWSCTEHRKHSSFVCGGTFSDGIEVWVLKDDYRLSSRLVRAELRP